ncbi:adenosylcobinamide-GDP ribazoletransferase [Paenibacillus sp. HB172176]|uniref:adenosylcobinamide-GDP ribazoletransferase n=1 Tax=Paenibacillus sp. HB172176 TaxID=2493690 RepID=UPI00143C5709|nr:adenosylcobinamide-GDP ribazoletransferase [Paenibacillus sp. HB172176]
MKTSIGENHPLRLQLQAAVAAIQFLTRLPLPVSVPFERQVLARSILYFPLAGLFIGLIGACASWLLDAILPPWPAAVLLLMLLTALSGGLHLDGLMDTADGVLSHRSRERMLVIMNDSRVGAMGVIAGVLLLLLKASLLAEWLKAYGNGDAAGFPALLILACCFSRAWMAMAIVGWQPARPGEGMGRMFNDAKYIYAVGAGVLALILSLIMLMINEFNYMESVVIAAAAALLTLAAGVVMARWLNRKLGGLTGDTYGAMNEGIEVVILLAATALMNELQI